jgi:hypothetical protein
MGIVNPRFTEPGTAPGQAKGWNLVSHCRAERWAAFGSNPPAAYEDFEPWSKLKLAFPEGEIVLGFFAPKGSGYEDFDRGWANDIYQTELAPALSAVARFGERDVESFDWVAKLLVAWAEVIAALAGFGGGTTPTEWFESAWLNDNYKRNWIAVPAVLASFGSASAETFEGAWPHATRL